MSRNKDIKNSGQNETGAGQETKALWKHVPDQALLFTAEAPIHTGMPPLISYISRHSRGIGESNRQLERQVMYRNSLASTISRAMHLPVLSKAFDFIRRTTAFFTPMYQRMLELPLLRRRSKTGSSSIQTKGAIADRQQNTISLQPNELYSQPIEEKYPMIASALLSTLPTRRNPAIKAYDSPHTASLTTLPWHTREIMAQHNQNVQTRSSHLDAIKKSVSRASEAPAVIKNVLSSPAAGMGIHDIDSEKHHYAPPIYMALRNKKITHSLEPEGGNELVSFQSVQSDATVPVVHAAYELREPDLTQTKAVEGRPTEVYRQAHYKYRTITLSPILMPITQRINLQRKSMKTGYRIIGEGIRETQSSSIFHIATVDEPIGQAVPIFRSLALSEQPATLEPKSVLKAYPPWSGSAISRGALGRPSPSKVPIIAKYPSEMTSSTRLHGKLTDRISTEMLPDRISSQLVQKPLVTSRVELLGEIPDSIYQTERMVGENQGKDSYYPSTTEHGRIGSSITRGQIIKPLFSIQPAAVAGSATQLSPEYESIHHTTNLATRRFAKAMYRNGLSSKTENYGFVPNREYMPPLPGKKYAYQQAPELALPSLLQEKLGSNSVYRKEALTGTSDIFPERTYSTKQNVPELALAPMNRIPEILTQPAESEPQEAGSNERVDKDDLDNIARDVYHILKRRLSRERERALGVI